jgi:hypothetical protein
VQAELQGIVFPSLLAAQCATVGRVQPWILSRANRCDIARAMRHWSGLTPATTVRPDQKDVFPNGQKLEGSEHEVLASPGLALYDQSFWKILRDCRSRFPGGYR